MKRFTPPGYLKDFDLSRDPELLYELWHTFVDEIVQDVYSSSMPFPRFYNPLDLSDSSVVPTPASITWSGFPRKISSWLGLADYSSVSDWEKGFELAETLEDWAICIVDGRLRRMPYNPSKGFFNCFPDETNSNKIDKSTCFSMKARMQDEYLEWHTYVDPQSGKVNKISFTAEPPEYWQLLGRNDPDLLVQLYRQYIDESISAEDLFWPADVVIPVFASTADGLQRIDYTHAFDYRKGDYNPLNKWNTTHGIMHLTQGANTLSAQIYLAADSTLRYEIGSTLRAEDSEARFKLAACAMFGEINRNSDPTIGQAIQSLVQSGKAVSVSDPIGLYISDVQLEGAFDPDNRPLQKAQIYAYQRGDASSDRPMIVRFDVVPPKGATYGLEVCSLGDFSLKNGGPIALQTSVAIHGEYVASDKPNPIYACAGRLITHPDKPDYYEQIDLESKAEDIVWTPPFDERLLDDIVEVANVKSEYARKPIKRREMPDS